MSRVQARRGRDRARISVPLAQVGERDAGDTGTGTLSDTIEGINWVIYHAKEYNIRVMNLSLAAQSTESWLTDPLCIAVRSASARWCAC